MSTNSINDTMRPTKFDDIVGHDEIVFSLKQAVISNRLRHAYLFSGPYGVGKTTTARVLAKAVNCIGDHPPCGQCENCKKVVDTPDIIEIDAATHNGVSEARAIQDKANMPPIEMPYKVVIIDEIHRFTGNAFDALLKTLEEPAPFVVFILATTELDRVPLTITSRTQSFRFGAIPANLIQSHLEDVVASLDIKSTPEALALIAQYSEGSLRDALKLVEMAIDDVTEISDMLGMAPLDDILFLVDCLFKKNTNGAIKALNNMTEGLYIPKMIARQLLSVFRSILYCQYNASDLVNDDVYIQYAGIVSSTYLSYSIKCLIDVFNDGVGGWQPTLPLELFFLEFVKGYSPFVAHFSSEKDDLVLPFQKSWVYVIRAIQRRNVTLAKLLENTRPISYDGEVLTIQTPSEGITSQIALHKMSILVDTIEFLHKVKVVARFRP